MSHSIQETLSERTSRRAIATLSIGHFCIDFWQGCFPAITALLAVARGYSYTTVGALVLAFNLASSVVQPLFGRIADKRSAQWLMPLGLSIASAGVVLGMAALPCLGVLGGLVLPRNPKNELAHDPA